MSIKVRVVKFFTNTIAALLVEGLCAIIITVSENLIAEMIAIAIMFWVAGMCLAVDVYKKEMIRLDREWEREYTGPRNR